MGIKRTKSLTEYLNSLGLLACSRHGKTGPCPNCNELNQSVRFDPEASDIRASNMKMAKDAKMIIVDMEMIMQQLCNPASKLFNDKRKLYKAGEAADRFVGVLKKYCSAKILCLLWDNRATKAPHRMEVAKERSSKRVVITPDDDDKIDTITSTEAPIDVYRMEHSIGRKPLRLFLERYIFDNIVNIHRESGEDHLLLQIGSYGNVEISRDLEFVVNPEITIEADTRIIECLLQIPVKNGTTVIVNNDNDLMSIVAMELPHKKIMWIRSTPENYAIDMTCLAHRVKGNGRGSLPWRDFMIFKSDYTAGMPHFRKNLMKTLPVSPISIEGDIAVLDLKQLSAVIEPVAQFQDMASNIYRTLFSFLYFTGFNPDPEEFGFSSSGYKAPEEMIPKRVIEGLPVRNSEIRFKRMAGNYCVIVTE